MAASGAGRSAKTQDRRIAVGTGGTLPGGIASDGTAVTLTGGVGRRGNDLDLMGRLLEPESTQVETSSLHGATACTAVLPKRGDSPKEPDSTSSRRIEGLKQREELAVSTRIAPACRAVAVHDCRRSGEWY